VSNASRFDVVTRTLTACVVFSWFAIAHGLPLLLIAFFVSLLAAIFARLRLLLVAFALLVPLLPILISHFAIEPYFSGTAITDVTKERALESWVRVGGMTLLSITWISTLSLPEAAQLCRVLVIGQYLLVPLQTATTFISVTRDRWLAIRELQALRKRGRLSKRTKVTLGQLPGVGLQLTLASLISSSEVALACQGRGIGSRRYIAVRFPRLTPLGVSILASLGLATVFIVRSGLA